MEVEAAALGVVKVSQLWHLCGFGGRLNTRPLPSQAGMCGAEGSHHQSVSNDEEGPSAVWHEQAASGNKGRFCSFPGPWLVPAS